MEFLLPDLGEGLTEASIVRWLVRPGDEIVVDQNVVEVESAKAVVELPCPFTGTVVRLFGEVGDTIERGAPLLDVEVASTGHRPAGPSAPSPAGDVPVAAEEVPTTVEPSGSVLVGYGVAETAARSAPRGARRWSAGTRPAAASAAPAVHSPIVRKLAADHGLDVHRMTGSGPHGLILRSDVAAAITAGSTAAATPQPASPTDGDERIPLSGLRGVIADRLSHSRRTIPEATIWLDVDATPLLDARRELQTRTGERFPMTALIARFAVAALRRYPALNASVDDSAREIVRHRSINLGLAAQTPRGLVVPVIPGADSMTLRQLRDGVATFAERAKVGGFTATELSGGTFTLNNYGGFGVDGSAPILNAPEAAMLGVGRMMPRPWVVAGQLAVREVVTLTLVFDHRVCDGDVAAGFLTTVAGYVESPIALLADL